MENKSIEIEKIKEEAEKCSACDLCKDANKMVFGEGSLDADLMFLGEGPGSDEDATGKPFVGRAGKLLTAMIECINLKREEIYIANIVKHRPPENRRPTDEEIATCMPFLIKQIEIIKPKIIVLLGGTALRAFFPNLSQNGSVTKYRGNIMTKMIGGQISTPRRYVIIPTYHPAFLLRKQSFKYQTWDDLKLVRSMLDKELAGNAKTVPF